MGLRSCSRAWPDAPLAGGGASLARCLAVCAAVVAMGCADPVRDDAIAALGDEEPGVPPGPDHRPGQPCLLCHSKGAPASGSPFAVAGTVYKNQSTRPAPAEGVVVQFVDARGGAPETAPKTGPAGNFFVPLAEWPDLAFPIRAGLYEDPGAPPKQTMKSLIQREGSCNSCHRQADDADERKSSVPPIYLNGGGG